MLLDGGRTDVLADEVGRQALHCIRCSACLNVCPVYSRIGGQAYESVYPGPIGAILTPQLFGLDEHADAAVGVVAVRRLLRRLPGQDRHPVACSCTCAGASMREQKSQARRPRGWRWSAVAAVFALAARYERAQKLARLGRGPLAKRRRCRAGRRCATCPTRRSRRFRDWWRDAA